VLIGADYLMGSKILRQESQDAAPTSSFEVEFALVLSRMIDSIKSDPQHLRETVYALARHKLQEQFTYENVKDMRPLSNALESAIRGVEAFARKNDPIVAALQKAAPAAEISATFVDDHRSEVYPIARPMPAVLDVPWSESIANVRTPRKTPTFTTAWRFVFLVAIVLSIGIAVQQRGKVSSLIRAGTNLLTAQPSTIDQPSAALIVPQQAAQTVSKPPVAKPSQPVPTSYGIYAVSEDKLYELELLPGRAPDIRVAISAAITTPSRTTLPDGHLTFIVYRRDSATSAADRAEVRVIAKVTRVMSFDPAGKAFVSSADDSWVIRNISIPYKTAPNKDDPDMYEIQSENPELELRAGRYALVLKGQAYDFTVAGPVTDPKQCLERLAAVNGQFYSECEKP
jgi:hypothetical protein